MSNLWVWLRNKIAPDDAYITVSTQLGDDLGGEPIFAALREFASSPVMPSAVPVLLLEAFNASQKRVSRRRKIRAGSGALFGVAILIPSLAYAGVLPSPVSRIVQRVFNVISLPIQIPSVATPSPSATKSNSDELTPGSTKAPDGEQSQSPDEMQTSKPSNESSPETNSTSDSELSTLSSTGDGGHGENGENGEQSVSPPVDGNLSVSGSVEVDGLPSISGLSDGLDGSQPSTSPGAGETDQVSVN